MFAYLYRTLYEALLEPDDDFFTRCRNVLIIVCFIFGTISVFTNTAAAVTKGKWPRLGTVSYYIFSVIWIASWMVAKLTRTSPDWLINLALDLGLCILVIGTFSSSKWGWGWGGGHFLTLSAASLHVSSMLLKLLLDLSTKVFQ